MMADASNSANSDPGDSATVVIKKYANRRLYDTSLSKYVNLEHIADLLRGGADVRVVEARSGTDVTRAVLTQIIVEGSRDSEGPPTEFLKDLIRAGDRAQRDFLHWYLSSAAQVYQRIRDGWEQAYRRSPAGRLNEQLRKQWDPASMVPALMRGLVPFLDPRSRTGSQSSEKSEVNPQEDQDSSFASSSTTSSDTARELAELRRQLDALAAKIED